MSKSTRRPQTFYHIIMWLLSLIFAGFLIGLGSLVIKDLPRMDQRVTLDQFVDAEQKQQLESQEEALIEARLALTRSAEDARQRNEAATQDYQAAKASYDNWVRTRSATQSAAQNPQVLSRTRALEELRAIERDALRRAQDAAQALTDIRRAQNDLQAQIQNLRQAAQPAYQRARNRQELRVFLYRLVLTLPLLAAGAWMVAKKRKTAYWPLYRGFVIFALFAFFVELVPYLPSYGGYVRYAVGIILIILASHFIIRGMRRYLERKQAEEARSESDRRRSIEYETALKKIAAKTCPGCDRSIVTKDGVTTHYCVHCGIRLQSHCLSCDHLNVSFHKFCLSCGVAAAPYDGEIEMSPDDAQTS